MARPKKLDQTRLTAAAGLLLFTGATAKDWGEFCADENLTVDQLERLKELARQAMRESSKVDLPLEFGVAKMRLEAAYNGAMAGGKYGEAVSAQKELDRVLNLLLPDPNETRNDSELEAAVAMFLHPLALCEVDLPPREHIRLAAARILELSAQKGLKVVG